MEDNIMLCPVSGENMDNFKTLKDWFVSLEVLPSVAANYAKHMINEENIGSKGRLHRKVKQKGDSFLTDQLKIHADDAEIILESLHSNGVDVSTTSTVTAAPLPVPVAVPVTMSEGGTDDTDGIDGSSGSSSSNADTAITAQICGHKRSYSCTTASRSTSSDNLSQEYSQPNMKVRRRQQPQSEDLMYNNLIQNDITLSSLDRLNLGLIYKKVLKLIGWTHKKGTGLTSWIFFPPNGSVTGLTEDEVMIFLKRLLSTHRPNTSLSTPSSSSLASNADEKEYEEVSPSSAATAAAVDTSASSLACAVKARSVQAHEQIRQYIQKYLYESEFDTRAIKRGLPSVHENIIAQALGTLTEQNILSSRIRGRYTFYSLCDNQWVLSV